MYREYASPDLRHSHTCACSSGTANVRAPARRQPDSGQLFGTFRMRCIGKPIDPRALATAVEVLCVTDLDPTCCDKLSQPGEWMAWDLGLGTGRRTCAGWAGSWLRPARSARSAPARG